MAVPFDEDDEADDGRYLALRLPTANTAERDMRTRGPSLPTVQQRLAPTIQPAPTS
jgi:hypothetical protein